MFEGITKRFSGILGNIAGKKISEKNIRETLREIRVALLEADVALEVIKEFLQKIENEALGEKVLKGVEPGQQFIQIVFQHLVELMGPVDPAINFQSKGPTVILMAGLQGSGKTTTCGKLAIMLRKQHKRRPLLVAADIQRPAAVDQLRTLGEQIKVPVFSQAGEKPPAICAESLNEASRLGCDTIILDTAGRLHIDEEMMGEVCEIARATSPHEIFLVCDAMVGQDAVKSAREFNERLELTGVILTKLDGDARGGAALSVKTVTGKPIKFVGTGEKLEGTLEEFRPEGMAERIFGFGDVRGIVAKAQEVVDADDAAQMQKELLEGTFTLEHFLDQLQSVKKMAGGNIRKLLEMVPGMGAQLGDMDISDEDLGHIEGVVRSMTPKERRRPEILNSSRRDRIAQGSGRTRMDVDDLLKQFNGMKKMMGQMTGASSKGPLGKIKAMAQAKKMMNDPHQMMHQMSQQMGAGEDPKQKKSRGGSAQNRKTSKAELKARRKRERKNRRKSRRR